MIKREKEHRKNACKTKIFFWQKGVDNRELLCYNIMRVKNTLTE